MTEEQIQQMLLEICGNCEFWYEYGYVENLGRCNVNPDNVRLRGKHSRCTKFCMLIMCKD